MTSPTLKLTIDQVELAIRLLNQAERDALRRRLLSPPPTAGEAAFAFWDDPEEDIYNGPHSSRSALRRGLRPRRNRARPVSVHEPGGS